MKRKFVCGIFALCLALSVTGCGKNSKEQQAANYYQNELGLDKEDAEELARELYGEDDEEQNVNEEGSEGTVVEPLPELVNSEWFEEKVQIYDMIFSNNMYMTEADIRAAAAGSAYNVELSEDFDSDGSVVLRNIYVDGELVAQVWKQTRDSLNYGNCVKYGLIDDGEYYIINYGPEGYMENNWYDKGNTEFVDLGTRDDVLSYLAENDFAEVEQEQAVYLDDPFMHTIEENIEPRDIPEGFEDIADTPHYFAKGAQSVTLYRVLKLGETDQEVEWGAYSSYSGAHLNLVNSVTFEFNTDGTVASVFYRTAPSTVYGERL